MPSTVPPYFSSHLLAERLTEELAVAQKKLKEYEDLISKLYLYSCEHCQSNFQRIANGARPVSKGRTSLASESSTLVVSPASTGGSDSLRASTRSHWYHKLKRPRIPLPGSFLSKTTTLMASHHASIQTIAETLGPKSDPKVSTPPPEAKPIQDQAQYFVKFDDSTLDKPKVLQVKLVHKWAHRNLVYSLKFSPDGNFLAVGVANNGFDSQKTYIYNVAVREKVCLLADRYAKPMYPSVHHLSFSPGDGSYLATGHSSGHTMVWHVRTKHVRNVFRASHGGQNYCIDFSPNGRFVAASTMYGSPMRIWSMRDGCSIPLHDRDGEAFASVTVKFSPDGKHVVASDLQGLLRIWNVRSSKLVRRWKAHKATALGLAFTPNGKGLVTASHDNTLKYWDLGPLGGGDLGDVEILKIVGHTTYVHSVAISPDSRWVISGSSDGTARIWDMVDATLQCTLVGHENVVSSVDFSPTGKYMACGSWDGKVLVWRYNESPGE